MAVKVSEYNSMKAPFSCSLTEWHYFPDLVKGVDQEGPLLLCGLDGLNVGLVPVLPNHYNLLHTAVLTVGLCDRGI